ncbi:MAG TPA: hypothetical protein VGX96_01795 [Candidatus Elarobacter sp.]|jgi:hypothetical protein|nr:hypothetical protein [Candidatus Elarobacter sp.]
MDGKGWTDLRSRFVFGWNVTRFFTRIFIEYVVAVWLLGIAPFIAHLAAALQQPASRFDWIPNDLYLFLMVIGGGAAMETFKDRKSEGPMRIVTGVVGVWALLFGAWAYGSLEIGTAPINEVLKPLTLRTIAVVLTFYLWYKVPFIVTEALREAVGGGKET